MRIIQKIKQYKFPVLLALYTRIGYSLWLLIVWLSIDKYIPLSPTALWESYHRLTRSTTLLGRALIDVWLRWDAVHYMNLAAFGYKGVGAADTVFFPLYPYVVGFFSKVTTINVTLVGILASSFFTLFAFIYLYDLVILLFNDETLAKISITLLALFPTAFFLHAPFTEALFLFCSIGCVLFLEKKNFIVAGFYACAAGLVRPQGLLLLIPIIYSLVQAYREQQPSFRWRETFSIGIAPLGFCSYLVWRSMYGQPGIMQSFRSYSNINFRDPFTNLFNVAVSIIKQPSVIRAAEFIFVLFFIGILVWMFCKKDFRRHLGIMLYSAASMLLIVSKTSVNGTIPQLSNRYVLYIFFAFVGIAFLVKKLPEKMQRLLIFSTIVLSLMTLTLYSLWIFIG